MKHLVVDYRLPGESDDDFGQRLAVWATLGIALYSTNEQSRCEVVPKVKDLRRERIDLIWGPKDGSMYLGLHPHGGHFNASEFRLRHGDEATQFVIARLAQDKRKAERARPALVSVDSPPASTSIVQPPDKGSTSATPAKRRQSPRIKTRILSRQAPALASRPI